MKIMCQDLRIGLDGEFCQMRSNFGLMEKEEFTKRLNYKNKNGKWEKELLYP